MNSNQLSNILQNGGVGVLPTDTLYGIVGSALNKRTIARIYKLRKRNPKKPFIILISSVTDLAQFSIHLTIFEKRAIKKFWPGKVSIVLPCPNKKLSYLHRGTKSLAFRLPKYKRLVQILKQSGPLVAPSANWEGKEPALTIQEAKKYFEDKVDFYVDIGKLQSKPSTLVKINQNTLEVLRQGAVKIVKI